MLMLQRAKESRSQANKTANMAAKHFYRQGFLLLLFNFISTAALEKRFSDFKRCADEECSMLLCRGKAVKDFSGPDCRFLSFKKSETIYVYYKLSGKRADLWAGSVGSNFGYFPKDLLAVNHLYTEKELEIKAEETDFVCFDTGYDKFDSYDIDLLLGLSVEENDGENNGITGKDTESIEEETKPSVEEVTEIDTQTEHVKSEELHEDQSASLPKLEINTSTDSSLLKDEESNTATVPVTEDEEVQQQNVTESPVQIMPESSETTDESDVESALVTVSEGVQIPQLNPTLGTTFDAVVTEEEITTKVTPYEEEDSEDLQDHPEEHKEEVPLLSFLEEPTDNLEMDSPKEQEKLSPAQKEDPNGTEEKNLWTSLGDAVFSVVTGGETTGEDVSSDEDDEDEDEDEIEETAAEPEKSFEKTETEPILPDNQKHPEDMEPPPPDPHQSNSVEQEINGTKNDPEKLLFDGNVGDQEVSEHKDEMEQEDKASNSPSEPEPHETEESSSSEEPVLNDDLVSTPDDDKSGDETPEDEDELEDPEISKTDDNIQEKTVVEEQLLDGVSDESRTTSEQELGITESEKVPDQSSELKESNDSDITVDQHLITDEKPDQINDNKVTDVESNTSPTLVSVEEEEIREQTHIEEEEDEKDAGTDKEINEEKEELLEDENALLSAQSDDVINEKSTEETTLLAESAEEPEYSENIMRLSLLREHFTEEKMEHIQKLLGLKNLFKVEAMFSDLDTELKATRLSHTDATQDVESTLENILEASENTILDEIEKMLDSREKKQDEHQAETSSLDEETEMLDDFQELAFSLRQKYSTTSDSAPLATPVTPLESTHDQPPSNVAEEKFLPIVEEKSDNVPETDEEYNLTVAEDLEEESTKIKEEQVVWNEENMIPEKDAEDSDKNKDQSSLTVSDEEEKVTQPTPDYQLDVDVETEVQHYPSGSVDYMETVKEKAEEELGLFTTGTVYMCCIFSVIKNKTVEWTTVMISLLPEEWKPGETLFGCPWQAVVVTVLIGVLTFTIFFWRTVLAVKKSKYLVDEKKLKDKIHTLIKDKSDALAKISELQKQTEQLKENQKQSKATVSCTMKRMQALESKVVEADKMNEQMAEEKNKYSKLLEEERAISLQNDSRLEKLEKANEKLQVSRKKIQEALAKTTILLDEAKIREDARNAQHKCFQKEFAALKEEKKTLKTTIKGWEEKHKELNEKIKVYQKSHKELEDSVVLKDHNVEVLSELLADLDACDLQKGETSVLANGEVAPADKKTAIKNRIKQMMDVTRVQTTLTVIEEERDRFMAKLLNEEKSRKELEEKHQELEHSIGALKSEKSQIENQYTILQQKNEIMVEMYQQKENALQQRLTKEELERRSKENLLSEVGGKAVEAEEQVKLLRQRINEMEEQMKKTEEVYKEQIKEQENKTHSNWVNARNAERALSQEKVESSKLREKLAILTSQLNERRAPLFRPNSGQPPGPRQGDSYGPSPVSGGAPSPPIMIEGPRRPPSAPVGRRIDPYGPRPPSDPHGIYPENKHIMDMMGPRSSSPANPDGSTEVIDPQIKTESQAVASTESPEPGPGSFIASPIRDSPGSMVQRPPPGPGPHDPFLPSGPNVRLPPPGPYGHPRPGPYPLPPGPLPPNVPPLHGPPLPANGHPGMPLPGPMGGEFGPRPANGHLFQPRLGPDQRGPPPPHFRPPPPHNFGPMPPPLGVRGPLGPRPLIPHDMRFPGPRDHISPPMDLLPGVPPPGGPPLPAHPGRGPPGNPQNSAGPQRGPAPDTHLKQEAPQDSVRPAMV